VTLGTTAEYRSGRFDSIERVGLAAAVTGLTVRTVDLDDLDAASSEEPGQPGTIGTGPFDADLSDLPEALEEGDECLVAGPESAIALARIAVVLRSLGDDCSARRPSEY